MYSVNRQKAETHVELSENYCLKMLNIIALIMELISLGYVLLDSNLSDFVSLSFMYHSSFMFLSVNYHLFPYLRTNIIFRFLAKTVWTISFMLLVMTMYYIIIAGGWDFFVFLFALVFFTGPASIVSFTLLLLLDYDTSSITEQENQYVYVAVVNPPPTYKLI